MTTKRSHRHRVIFSAIDAYTSRFELNALTTPPIPEKTFPMPKQEREPVYAAIQSATLKVTKASALLEPTDARWLVAHAVPNDLRELADKIEAKSKQ